MGLRPRARFELRYCLRYIVICQKQNFLTANWISPADSIRNVFWVISSSFVWLGKLSERTALLWRDNSRRVRTHEKNSGETVRRLGTITQSIFCAQSGASIHLTVLKWSCESRYPGALPLVLENFRRAFSPGPTDCPWVSEDGFEVAANKNDTIFRDGHGIRESWKKKKQFLTPKKTKGMCARI